MFTTFGARRPDLLVALQAFVLVDLLFFPRLLFAFGIPVSLLIVGVTFFYRPLQLTRLVIVLALLVVMLNSVTYGAVSGQNLIPEESLKRAIQLFTILLYSFFRLDAQSVLPVLVKVLRGFYVWTFCMMLLFLLQPDIYQQLMAAIYPESLDQLENNTLVTYRFAYFFSDPNSAAYLICFTLAAYLSIERNLVWGIVCTVLAILTILVTQSRGAYIAVILIIVYSGVVSKTSLFKKLLIIGSSCMVLLSVASFYSDQIEEAYTIFDARFDQEEDLGGGRAGKYEYFAKNINFLPIGHGYHLRKDGDEFRPHSDLIRLNLSYGIMALPLILHLILPRRKSQALIFVVFLVPFLINTVIDDYRLFGIYLLLFSILGQLNIQSSSKLIYLGANNQSLIADSTKPSVEIIPRVTKST